MDSEGLERSGNLFEWKVTWPFSLMGEENEIWHQEIRRGPKGVKQTCFYPELELAVQLLME